MPDKASSRSRASATDQDHGTTLSVAEQRAHSRDNDARVGQKVIIHQSARESTATGPKSKLAPSGAVPALPKPAEIRGFRDICQSVPIGQENPDTNPVTMAEGSRVLHSPKASPYRGTTANWRSPGDPKAACYGPAVSGYRQTFFSFSLPCSRAPVRCQSCHNICRVGTCPTSKSSRDLPWNRSGDRSPCRSR